MVAVTTLLVLYTLFTSTSDDLPKTAEIKMLDVWFFFCILLLFIIIVLHVFVDYAINRASKQLHGVTKVSSIDCTVGCNNFEAISGCARGTDISIWSVRCCIST